jgi:hypothetical protein
MNDRPHNALVNMSGTALGVPLNNQANPHLKPATSTKPNAFRLTMQGTAHDVVTPTAHQGGPLEDPLEQAPPRSRVHASLGQTPSRSRGCACLERAPPRSMLRPRTRSASLEGTPHACARSRTRALNVLTPAGRRHHAPGARAPVPPHQLPRREPHPRHCGSTVRRGRCQSRDAAPPAPVRLTR